ncbi:MAG TPA: hypothetical protein VI456_11455 [Polyangia bacterium]
MIAGALSVVLALALAGDPPDPAAPDVVVPEAAASAVATPAAEPPAPPVAPARGSFVAVVRPATPDPLLQEASSRIRSELAASGLESRLVDCAEPTEAPCPGPDAAAAIALGRRDGVVEIDVRAFLPDGFELARHVRVLDRDGGQDPSVLGVRAVELLRDLRLNAQRRAPPGPPKPAEDPEEPKIPLPPPPPPRWRVSTGVAALGAPPTGKPGFGPSLGAALRGAAILDPRLVTVLTIAGPFDTAFSTTDEQASLIQALATLELRYRFPARVVQPFVAVLTGINYLRETLTSPATTDALTPALSTAWVPLFGAGGGVSYDLGERFSIVAEAEIFATAPDVLVELDNNTVVARTGTPSILVTADLTLTLP